MKRLHPRRSLFDLWENHWPKIVAAVGATVVAIGASSMYINLPKRVDAAEKNIEDLKGWAKEIQGYTRAMNQQKQASNSQWNGTTEEFTEEDKQGRWRCVASSRKECWDRNLWRPVE